MAHRFCDCLPWREIGDRAKAELDRYTAWLRKHRRAPENPYPNERYPSEGLFRNGMILWLSERKDIEFINVESGYVSANTPGNYKPKCDLQFALGSEEHWVEFKTGPGPGNSFYKKSPKEWIGKWSADVMKLRHSEIPADAKRHLLSFGLSKTGEDGLCAFYGQHFSKTDGEPNERFALSFCDLGAVDWKCGTVQPDQELNRLFMTVVCVHPVEPTGLTG